MRYSQYESWNPLTGEAEAREFVGTWVGQQNEDPRRHYTLAIELQGEFIGLCGLDQGFSVEADDPHIAFVGYRLLPEHWNQGYATETVRALIHWGFAELDLHRIHSGCVRENGASVRVLEKAGMIHEGTTRRSFPIGDDWHDFLVYGLLQEDRAV
jgi:ribosomal-protein-alanine N-acetyltransferase